MYGVVYRITNTRNGKVYIGQTTMGIERRWAAHLYAAANDKSPRLPIYMAIRKYGRDAFTIDVIDVASSKEELDRLEDAAIRRFDALNSSNGYNAKSGGANGRPSAATRAKMSESRSGPKHFRFGKTLSDEHKFKLSQAGRLREASQETREKLRLAGTGRRVSPDTKAKIGAARRGHKMPEHVMRALRAANDNRPSHLRVAVLCTTTGQRFPSMRSAADFAGVSVASMSRHIGGGQQLSTGMTFKRDTA